MTKFCGTIGIRKTVNKGSGIWVEDVDKRTVYGEVKSNTRRLENGESINDNVNVNNTFEIVGDEDIFERFYDIVYISWRGQNWKVSNIDFQPPRLILTIGGIYNGYEEGTE